jgi:hypothetical protein
MSKENSIDSVVLTNLSSTSMPLDKQMSILVEMKEKEKPWYLPSPPTVGDYLVALSLIIGALTWAYNQYKNRKQRESQLEQAKEELKWKRAQFLFEYGTMFDTNADISEATKIITGHATAISISNIFNDDESIDPTQRGLARHRIDKLLNLLERLSYAYKKDILTLDELRNFEWYYTKVSKEQHLRRYCDTYYPDVVNVAKKLDENIE